MKKSCYQKVEMEKKYLDVLNLTGIPTGDPIKNKTWNIFF